MTYRVLLSRPLPAGGDEPLVAAGYEIVRAESGGFTHEQLVDLAGRVDGIVSVLSDRVDQAVLNSGRGRLRVVANVAVGYDNVDVASATQNQITVCNTPGVLDEATADLAFLLLLSAARRASEAETDLRSGRWNGWRLTDYLGQELHGRTLGLVGYGRIAQAVARRAEGFGLATTHFTRSDTGVIGWTSSLDELLSKADFVSLHVPLTRSTHHMIDRRRLALMKPTAILINTARGPIVDEEALAEALESGAIFGAGLDVYEKEPVVHPRLLSSPRTSLLPHIGSATEATRRLMAQMACRSIVDVLSGLPASNRVLS